MIDLIDSKRKVIYRFTTDIQSVVEDFCLTIGSHYHGKSGCAFSTPANTHHNRKIFKNFQINIVKATITKKGYKFEMGPHLQEKYDFLEEV